MNHRFPFSLRFLAWPIACCLLGFHCRCGKNSDSSGGNPNTGHNGPQATVWMTTGDGANLLALQAAKPEFGTEANSYINIEIDSSNAMQGIDGFGYTLTGGSAYLINQMGTGERSNLLNELFGQGDNAIGVSYLRVSIGASDLDPVVFSYDDLPAGQTDTALTHFSLSRDTVNLIPVLKQVLSINPSIKILGSPWSPPVWMKDNGQSMGGGLLPQYYAAYAKYFVKYIQAMKAQGITVDAITIQNEPQHGGNNPSMVMNANEQAAFIRDHLGPAFAAAGVNTKIIIWDHNCDNPNYPITVLNDAGARAYVNGSAFHLYNGDISALTTVHDAYPDKQLYFTEQWTGANGSFSGDLRWHVRNVVIGSVRNWSRIALEWNLASDPNYNPHTPGGCTECKGAVTINGSNVTRNVGYYIIAHASKFVPPGSRRIGSNNAGNLINAAFVTPDGKKVVVAVNDGNSTMSFNIKQNGKWFAASLAAGAVATYTW